MKIVSFYAPRPEHPLFQDYTPFLRVLEASCQKFGHEHIVLSDVQISGFKTFKTDLPRPLMKAFIKAQLDFLKSGPFADDIIFVGADGVLANDPADIFDGSFDIGITTHNFSDCWLNSGAIFIPKGVDAAPIWQSAYDICGEEWGDDQLSLAEQFKPLTLEHGVYERRGYRVGFLPVDPWNLAPDNENHDCSHAKILHFRGPRKRWMSDYCRKFLGVEVAGLPEGFRPFLYQNGANVTEHEILENMRVNCARDLPWFMPTRDVSKIQVALVGGGPSLSESVSAIRQRRSRGQKIAALNNAWRMLPFEPDFILCMDSREGNAEFFKDAPSGSTYLVASTAHPSVFEMLAGKNIIVWHADQGLEEQKAILNAYEDKPGAMLGGGGTIGLRALIVFYWMGVRRFHLYGFDSSYRDGKHHAYAQSLNDGAEIIEISPAGFEKTYSCAPWMARQADEFQSFYKRLLKLGCFVQAHGEGLLPDLCRHINEQVLTKKTEIPNA